MSQSAVTGPALESDEGRQRFRDKKKVQKQHQRDTEVDETLVMLRVMMRDVVAEGIGNLQRAIMQTERNLTLRLCRVEDMIAKEFAIRHSSQMQPQQQKLEEAGTFRLQPPSPAPVWTASMPPLPVHPAPVQAASPASASARQAPPAALQVQWPSTAPTSQAAPSAAAQAAMMTQIMQQAPVPPTAPVVRHSAPAGRTAAAAAPASTKQNTAATGQTKPPPNGVAGSAAASSTGRSATGTGHGTASAGSGDRSRGITSWFATSFWSSGDRRMGEGFRTVEEAEAYFFDQCVKELRQGPRPKGRAASAPAAAEDFADFPSTQPITYRSEPSPMTLPGMTGNQAPDEFAHVMPPQQVLPATGGKDKLRTLPGGRYEAAAAESASSSSPQQRTGLRFSRLLGM